MTEKRGRGRPSFEPTDKERQLVESLSGFGLPHEDIALLVRDGIDDKTLRKHFRRELDTGMTKANAKVVESLYQQAVGGNVTAAIWWTKGRMGWRETSAHEHTGKDGGPVQVSAADEILKRLDAIAGRKGE